MMNCSRSRTSWNDTGDGSDFDFHNNCDSGGRAMRTADGSSRSSRAKTKPEKRKTSTNSDSGSGSGSGSGSAHQSSCYCYNENDLSTNLRKTPKRLRTLVCNSNHNHCHNCETYNRRAKRRRRDEANEDPYQNDPNLFCSVHSNSIVTIPLETLTLVQCAERILNLVSNLMSMSTPVKRVKWNNMMLSILMVLSVISLSSVTLTSAADIGKYFTRSPQSIVAPPGDRVTFQCETNIPAEQVRWKLNGRFLHPANESDIRITGNFLGVKVSKSRERFIQQVGDYQCVVEFGAEALTSLPAQLTIAHMDPFKPHENQTLMVVEGNAVAISCDPPYSNPPPIIQFYKDGKILETEIGNLVLTDSGVLLINNVSSVDSGTYWCSVTNHITSDTFYSSWSTRLTVQKRGSASRKSPEFLLKPKSYVVVPKDGNATLECVAAGNPPPFTSFRKLRAPSMSNSRQSTRSGNLHLVNAGLAQEGEYICEAYNGVGDTLTTLSTVVLNSMPNITKEPVSLVVEEGGEASMDCATEGLPKPRVYWVFNGHNVHNDGNIQITDWGLKISRVEKKHAGLFQCFGTNPMGTVTSPAELKVMPKMITAMANDSTDMEESVSSGAYATPPVTRHHHGENHHHKNNKFHRGKHKRRKHKGQDMIPPSKPSMNRISDESVMVRWSVPPNNGYPIQFFKIQYKEVNKGNRWMTIDDDIPPHIHSYEVRDLSVGHAYRFRIAAVYSNNDNKVGPNSDKLVLTKDTSMHRPIYVPVVTTAAPHNSTAIKLQWKHMRGEGGGGGLDGYFIYYREAHRVDEYSKVTVLGAESDSYYITHLKPGTGYDIKIQAFNRAGASNFSSIIGAKTLGSATTEKPEEDKNKDKKYDVPDEPAPSKDHLYLLLGCLFAGFWIFLCLACAVCYKCKQKRAEEEAKYPCDIPNDIEAKTIPNGALNSHPLNGYLPSITSHVDEKETSFVERHHNNNRPISPSQLGHESTCDDLPPLTYKSPVPLSQSLERRSHHHLNHHNLNNTLNSDNNTHANNKPMSILSPVAIPMSIPMVPISNLNVHHNHNTNNSNNSLGMPMSILRKDPDNSSCNNPMRNSNNSLSRKKQALQQQQQLQQHHPSNNLHNNSYQNHNQHQQVQHHPGNITQQNNSGSLRRGPYVSCSSEDLDCDSNDGKNSKIFPKEHYKVSRKHSRKRNSMVDG